MQLKVKELRDAFKLLEGVVPKSTNVPVLRNILFKGGKAIAGDMETFILLDVPSADIDFLAPHKAVLELLNYVPGDETITVEANKELKLSWESGNASYPIAKIKDYPLIKEMKPTVQAELDGNLLIRALSDVSEYCTTDESRPLLTGVILFPGEKLDVAAGDGFRMAYQTIPVSFPIEKPVVIPRGSVSLLGSLWRRTTAHSVVGDTMVERVLSKRKIELALLAEDSGDPDKLQVQFDTVTVLSKLISGSPPNFKDLLPKEPPTSVLLFPDDLERAIKRLKDVAKDSKGIIRLTWEKDAMTVSAQSEEKGKIEGTLPVQASNSGKVALSMTYLLRYLKGKEGLITMGFTQVDKPVTFNHRMSPLVVLMPMFVSW